MSARPTVIAEPSAASGSALPVPVVLSAESPAAVAAGVARVRTAITVLTWLVIGLGLVFTAVNVQVFAAAGALVGSPQWLVAWLLDPMVSLLLVAVVLAEQITARWQIATGWQVTAVKWGCFTATYAMNTWTSWRELLPSGVVLHSVPPMLVLLATGVAPVLRDRLTEAVSCAEARGPQPVAAASGGDLKESFADQKDLETPSEEQSAAPLAPLTDPKVADAGSRSMNGAVLQLAARVAAGEALTGAAIAAERGCSPRNARRLLAEARKSAADAPSDVPKLELVEISWGLERRAGSS